MLYIGGSGGNLPCRPTGKDNGLTEMATSSIWMPKHYSMTEDFELWTRKFESYCRAEKVADGLKCDVLLVALDDDAFKAVDALGLSDEVLTDYTQQMNALEGRFASTTSQFELRFRLRCHMHVQEALREYLFTPESIAAEVQSVHQHALSRFSTGHGRGRIGGRSTLPSRTPDRRSICFKCREPGHIRMQCPKRGI